MRKFFCQNKNRTIIIVVMILLFSTMNYYYADTNSIIRQSINFWKALFSSRILQYNQINSISVQSGEMLHASGYSFFLTLLMSIWQLPLYIIERLLSVNVLDFFIARVYGKLYLVILILMCSRLVCKIYFEITKDNSQDEKIFLMFSTSAFIFSSVCIVGQIDIFGVYFTLLAIYFIIKEDRKKFYLFAFIAFQCKYFPIFILIPIILLFEKKIWKIVVAIFSPLVIGFCADLLFGIEESTANTSRTEELIESLTSSRIELMGMSISISIIFFITVCMIAYFVKIPKKEDSYRWYLFFGYIGYLAVYIVYAEHPYRVIYLLPFTTLYFFLNKNNQKRRLFIETIASLSVSIGFLAQYNWCYDMNVMSNMLIDKILPLKKFILHGTKDLLDFFLKSEFYGVWTVLFGIYVIYLIGVAIYNNPWKTTNGEEFDDIGYKHLWIRTGASFLVANMTITVYMLVVIKSIIIKIFGLC